MCKSDVIHHVKAPDLSFVTTVATFALVFIWSLERYKAAHAIRDCKKLTHVLIWEKKNKEFMFQTCLPCHMTASSFVNRNNAARLHFFTKFLREMIEWVWACSMQVELGTLWQVMFTFGKQRWALCTEGLTFSFLKLWDESSQLSSLRNSCPYYCILYLSDFS